MDQWEILGTEKTTDVVKIKRAYAARAKQWHPEEHPEEFKRLQGAYRAALAWAKAEADGKNPEAGQTARDAWTAGAAGNPSASGKGDAAGSHAQSDGPDQTGWTKTGQTARDAWTARSADGSDGDAADGHAQSGGPAPDFDVVNDAIREEITKHRQEHLAVEAWLAVKNPYLQNNPAYWRHLFSREEYRDLIRDRIFMGKLARILSKEKGWYRGTIRLIDRQIRPADPGLRWKWLRYRPYDKPPLAEGVSSTKLAEIHRMLLGRIRETGYPDDIDHDGEALAAYLEQYIPFANQNTRLLEQAGRTIRRVRAGMLGVFAAMLFVIACVICAGAGSRPSERTRTRADAGAAESDREGDRDPGERAGRYPDRGDSPDAAGEGARDPDERSGGHPDRGNEPGAAGEDNAGSGGDAAGEDGAGSGGDAPAAEAGSVWNQKRLDELEEDWKLFQHST